MPIHDWTRVFAGAFHDFHATWIIEIKRALNAGILPDGYYALAEQVAGMIGPDVLTLRSLLIRHMSNDRMIAMIEIVSPGNKSSRHAARKCVKKVVSAIRAGIHMLLIDLLPPGPRESQGIHRAVWSEVTATDSALPPEKQLTLAAYVAGRVNECYLEPVAVGDVLPDMPLFLDSESYVQVPLESAYQRAWETVPRHWRALLES